MMQLNRRAIGCIRYYCEDKKLEFSLDPAFISRISASNLLRLPNCGKITLKHIHEWLRQFPVVAQSVCICPHCGGAVKLIAQREEIT